MFDNLIKELDADISLVQSPDHPVLVAPPDAIAAKNGKLTAYYKVKHSEASNPKKLLSRLALSRFAFPVHTQHVLVVDDKIKSDAIYKVCNYFDETVGSNELKLSLLILNDQPKSSTIDRATIGRDKHYVKYNLLFNESVKQLENEGFEERGVRIEQDVLESAYYSDWLSRTDGNKVKKSSLKSKYFYKGGNGYFANPDFEKSKHRHDLLRSLCMSFLQIDSIYDDGIFQKSYHSSSLILSSSLPGYRHDDLKGVRCAAFAGLGLSHARSMISIKKYSEFLSYKFERGIREFGKKKNRYDQRNNRR